MKAQFMLFSATFLKLSLELNQPKLHAMAMVLAFNGPSGNAHQTIAIAIKNFSRAFQATSLIVTAKLTKMPAELALSRAH